MFNYYKMKLKGTGGGRPNAFFLNMWLGGAGTFLVFIGMFVRGTGFKGRDIAMAWVIASLFYLYALFFFAQHYKSPRLVLLVSSGIFLIMSTAVLLEALFLDSPFRIIFGVACLLFYGVAFNLTRICIKYRYFQKN